MYKLNDEDRKKINTKMLAEGFKECKSNFFDSNDYKSLAAEMIMGLPKYSDQRLFFDNCTKQQLLAAGKYVIDKHAHGGDIRVCYTDRDSMKAEINYLFGEHPKKEQYDEIIKYIDDNIDMIKVTDVPVALDLLSSRNGHTGITHFYGYNLVDEEFYKNITPVVNEISIEGACDDDSKCTYVHEMYHALAGSHKGSIENLLHGEVLSIFMEKVASSDLDSTGKLEEMQLLARLLNNKYDFLEREHHSFVENQKYEYARLMKETYILSTTIATDLFNKYKRGSNRVKNEIDDSINGIFREEHTLEDVLKKYEATPEEGSKIMRKQIKKYSK